MHHQTLLDNLIGIRGNLLNLLIGRKMRTFVHGFSSPYVDVLSGVPQGSVLGPTLFLIFINYVAHDLNSKFCLFTDDLKVYIASSYDTYLTSSQLLQNDLDTVFIRSTSWGLPFSDDKSTHMHFSRLHSVLPAPHQFRLGNSLIPLVNSQRDLGIIVDPSLKFHLHIRETARPVGFQDLLSTTLFRMILNSCVCHLLYMYVLYLTMLHRYGTRDT